MLTPKTKTVLACVAAAILLVCIAITVFDTDNELAKVSGYLHSCGYNIYSDDIIIAFDDSSTTIQEAMGNKPLDDVIAVSMSAGYQSRVDKQGAVTLLLATDGNDTIYLYMLDGERELCFVEEKDGKLKELAVKK